MAYLTADLPSTVDGSEAQLSGIVGGHAAGRLDVEVIILHAVIVDEDVTVVGIEVVGTECGDFR